MDLNTSDNIGARTRSRSRTLTNTAIPKESVNTKKRKSSKKSRKSRKRKIAQVSDDCEINLNAKELDPNNISHVIPECPSNYADNGAIQGPPSVASLQDDSDDDVIFDQPIHVSDDCEINLNAKELHPNNISHVIPECPSNYADNGAIQGPPSVVIAPDDSDDDVIFDQPIHVSDDCEINLNAKELHPNNISHVIPECPSNYADNGAIQGPPSVVIVPDDDDVPTIYISDSENEAGYDSDVIETATIDDPGSRAATTNHTSNMTVFDSGISVATGIDTLTINDSDSEASTTNQTSIIVHDMVSDAVPGKETFTASASNSKSSLSDQSSTKSGTETPTTTSQKYCTDESPNNVSIPSQLSDVSSLSLQSINNKNNQHFVRRRRNLKRLKKNLRKNKAQASSNPTPARFDKKFSQRKGIFSSSPQIDLQFNQRLQRDQNNNKTRRATVSFAKAIHKDPHISKKLHNIKAKECKELLTNTCNFKKFNTITPAYGAHAKPMQPNGINSNFSTIRPTESARIRTNSINFRNYNTFPSVKRMVIIDGSNVAFAHSSQKEFSVKGIQICLNYFLQRGHEVKAVIPQHRLKQSLSTNRHLIEQLNNGGKLIICPCRTLTNGKFSPCYDDRLILDLALDRDAAVISNDNFLDLVHENAKYQKVTESRVIGYTFFKNSIFFPEDPYGKKGPSLNEILTKRVNYSKW